MKIEYICHPVGGNIRANVEDITRICRERHTNERIPFAPYISFLQYLDDNSPWEKELGMISNAAFFENKTIDSVYVCGDRITGGMKREIVLAYENSIPIEAETHLAEEVLKALPFHNSYVGQRSLLGGNVIIVMRAMRNGDVLAYETSSRITEKKWKGGQRGVPIWYDEAFNVNWSAFKHNTEELLNRIVGAWGQTPISVALAA